MAAPWPLGGRQRLEIQKGERERERGERERDEASSLKQSQAGSEVLECRAAQKSISCDFSLRVTDLRHMRYVNPPPPPPKYSKIIQCNASCQRYEGKVTVLKLVLP